MELQLQMQWVPITTRDASSNPAHDEMCSIQLYEIKFVNDLWLVGGFLRVFRFTPPVKLTYDRVVSSSSIYGFRFPFGIFKLFCHCTWVWRRWICRNVSSQNGDILTFIPSPQFNIGVKTKKYGEEAKKLVMTNGYEWNSVDDIKGVYTDVFGTPQVNT